MKLGNKIIIGAFALVLIALAIAQVLTVSVGVGGKSVNIQLAPTSTVSFSLPDASADANGLANLVLGVSTTRRPASALQFDVSYFAADVTSVTLTADPAVTAQNKSLQCAPLAAPANGQRCLVVGLNNAAINNGPIVDFAAVVNKATTFTISNVVASSANGTALLTSIAPNGGVITVAIGVAAFACTSPAYENITLPANTYALEKGESLPCSVSLNQPADSAGFSVTPTLGDPSLTNDVVHVAAGQTSTTFNINRN